MSRLSETGLTSPVNRCCYHDGPAALRCPLPEEYVAVVMSAVGLDGSGLDGEPWELGACAEHAAALREESAVHIVSMRSA